MQCWRNLGSEVAWRWHTAHWEKCSHARERSRIQNWLAQSQLTLRCTSGPPGI